MSTYRLEGEVLFVNMASAEIIYIISYEYYEKPVNNNYVCVCSAVKFLLAHVKPSYAFHQQECFAKFVNAVYHMHYVLN